MAFVSSSSSHPAARRPNLSHRRRQIFLTRLDAIFAFVDDAFAHAEFVPEVALVFGATVLSPKVRQIIVALTISYSSIHKVTFDLRHHFVTMNP